MLEFGGQKAFEVVFDDEDAEKIGIAAGAENVPGKRSGTKAGDGHGMKTAEGGGPALGGGGPKKNGAARKNQRGGAFGESGEAEEEAEQKGGK